MPIKTLKLSTSDLFAFALYAITLNQERSVEDVGPMQNIFFLLFWLFVQLDVITAVGKHMEMCLTLHSIQSFNNIYFIDYVGFWNCVYCTFLTLHKEVK